MGNGKSKPSGPTQGVRARAGAGDDDDSHLDHKVTTGTKQERQLLDAAKANDLERVRSLIREGVDVSFGSNSVNIATALHEAARGGFAEMTQVLLEAGARQDAIDSSRYTPLITAARGQKTAVVRALCADRAARAVVNHQGNDGRTALHFAAIRGHAEIVQALLGIGAATDIEDKQGRTAAGVAKESVKAFLAP